MARGGIVLQQQSETIRLPAKAHETMRRLQGLKPHSVDPFASHSSQ
jgi:hypothetical protein